MGINFVLAPVLDINNNLDNPVIGVRSFGRDADTVCALGREALRGFRRLLQNQLPQIGAQLGQLFPVPLVILEQDHISNEDLDLDGDAKEAVAFAILANEAVHGICSNAPAATGASHPVVMGKIK